MVINHSIFAPSGDGTSNPKAAEAARTPDYGSESERVEPNKARASLE